MQLASWRWALVAGALVITGPTLARAADGGAMSWGRVGNYVLLGGGVTGFTDDTAKDAWDMGGTWDLRFGTGSRQLIGAELAYVGAYNPANVGDLDLLSNGADAVVRLQYPITRGALLVEPFAFGGIGWRYLSVRNAPAGVEDSDNIGDVPVGAGLTLGTGRFLVDARFTYRWTFNEDLGGAATDLKMHNWAVNASVGIEF